jgi:hypothetical protein
MMTLIKGRSHNSFFSSHTKAWNNGRNASDKVYQLLAHGQWFSPGTPAYSTTKTGRHYQTMGFYR